MTEDHRAQAPAGDGLPAFSDSFPPTLLTRRQPISSAFIGILAGTQFKPDRRSLETKRFAEPVDQVALIAAWQAFCLVAVNDNHRRALAALVRIAELDPVPAHDRGRMRFDRCVQNAVQFIRRQITYGRCGGPRGAMEPIDYVAAMQCRDAKDFDKI